MDDFQASDSITADQRLTPRDNDHLQSFPVDVVQGEFTYAGRLVDESVTGVGVRLEESADIRADTSVVVRSGANSRDAIVQRVWIGNEGETRLGLLWRAAQFR